MKSKGFSIGIIFLVLMVCTTCTKDEDLLTPDGESSALKKASITLNVPVDYSTIQAAVDAAGNGGIIMVSSGTYEENVNIENIDDLTLIGDNSIINQIEIGSAINLYNCNNFKVSGFELSGEDKSFPAIGLFVHNSSGEISECVVNGFWHGIYATNSPGEQSELLVTECDIQEFEKYGVVTWKGVHSSINKNSFLKSVVTLGEITACVSVWGGTPKIKKNNFNNPGNGITLTDDAYNIDGQLISVNAVDSEIKSNDFHNCSIGINIRILFGGEVLNTNIVNNVFFDVNTEYLIKVDENEVHIRPKI